MAHTEKFRCSCCGELHDGPPMDWAMVNPDYWSEDLANDPSCKLTSDWCVIEDRDFFVRGCLDIPIKDAPQSFMYGVWVSLSRENFNRMQEIGSNDAAIAREPSYFGWFSNELPGYPSTINLRTQVHLQVDNNRPRIELESTDHPLALEQRNGITMERVREIAANFEHSPG